jgi:hypothetical protein
MLFVSMERKVVLIYFYGVPLLSKSGMVGWRFKDAIKIIFLITFCSMVIFLKESIRGGCAISVGMRWYGRFGWCATRF